MWFTFYLVLLSLSFPPPPHPVQNQELYIPFTSFHTRWSSLICSIPFFTTTLRIKFAIKRVFLLTKRFRLYWILANQRGSKVHLLGFAGFTWVFTKSQVSKAAVQRRMSFFEKLPFGIYRLYNILMFKKFILQCSRAEEFKDHFVFGCWTWNLLCNLERFAIWSSFENATNRPKYQAKPPPRVQWTYCKPKYVHILRQTDRMRPTKNPTKVDHQHKMSTTYRVQLATMIVRTPRFFVWFCFKHLLHSYLVSTLQATSYERKLATWDRNFVQQPSPTPRDWTLKSRLFSLDISNS